MRIRGTLLSQATIAATVAAVAMTACGGHTQADASTPPAPAVAPPAAQPTAAPQAAPVLTSESPVGQEVVSCMNPQVNPCEDFYQYACGGWLARTPLPADKPSFGRGFGELRDRNTMLLKQALEQPAPAGSELALATTYYASCMDEASVEANGMSALRPYLDEIDGAKSVKDVLKVAGKYSNTVLGSALFSVDLGNDYKDPDLYILEFGQGGLGLPDRAYYLEKSRENILTAYTENTRKFFELAGSTAEQAQAAAANVVAFEKKLAEISMARDELRDPEKLYHPTTRGELEKTSKLDLKTYLKAAGFGKLPKTTKLNVATPAFLEALPGILATTDVAVLRDYLRAHALRNAAPRLHQAMVDTGFQFTATLTGAKQNRQRWERCVETTTQAFPDVVAKIYVDKHFAGESRAIALQMIQDIEAAFVDGLPKLAWMDDQTRTRAIGKMKAIANKIGFPDKWRTYEGAEVGKNYFANYVAASTVAHKKAIAKVGNRVDPQEWFIPASMVNAFYNPSQNEMVFPAGILQPPYFSASFPNAMNYGAMGMVMGHELTHGFDDQGRKFDGDGVMAQWWDPAVSQRFEERAACIEKAYSSVEVQPGVNINGKLTLGENIADNGGIKEAHRAYQMLVARNGAEPQLISGLTNEQLFFVAYAQGWCTQMAPEYEKFMVTVDPHSPPRQRVNVPLANLPAFWQAFSCAENTKMHAPNACEIW